MRELPGALAGPRVVTLGGTEDPLAIDRNEMLRYLGHTGQNIETTWRAGSSGSHATSKPMDGREASSRRFP